MTPGQKTWTVPGRRMIFCCATAASLAWGLVPATGTQRATEGKSITVEELEKIMVTLQGKSDGAAAGKLAGYELTERATSARLARWETEFPGNRSRQALTVLADQSAFLDLPAADHSQAPVPDIATQKQILMQAVAKVSKALTALPNFYATRETAHFEDTMAHEDLERSNEQAGGKRVMTADSVLTTEMGYVPLHLTNNSSLVVTYRDGSEELDTQKGKKAKPGSMGMTTGGEFGPILTVVLADALHSQVSFSYWEQRKDGPLAIYRYTVPKENSHYMVRLNNVAKGQPFYPAYHGEIAVDPASGDIYRITEIADLDSNANGVECAIAVEYAPVEIGGRMYVCPARSVALSKVPGYLNHDLAKGEAVPLQTHLNDVAFTQYHLFRSESRIVPAGSTQ